MLLLHAILTHTKTHNLHVLVKPRTDYGGNSATYFRVKKKDLKRQNMVWLGHGLHRILENKGRGIVGAETAAPVECAPLGIPMVPFGLIFAKI